MVSLAPVDCKILSLLDIDARTPLARIGRQLRISPDTVQYHLDKLVQDGVIDRFAPVIDLSRLGLHLFRISLRLKTGSELHGKLPQLSRSPLFSLLAETRGTHDAILWGQARSLGEIQSYAETVQNTFSKSFVSATIEVITETRAYSRGYLVNRPGHAFPGRGSSTPIHLDRFELSLLELLGRNARASQSELARRLNSTPAIVGYRMEKLERLGVLLGYRLHLNAEQIGVQRFRVQLEPLTSWARCRKELLKFCGERPAIVRLERQLGAWPLEIGMEIDSFSAVHSSLDELRNRTAGAVAVRGIDLFRKTHLSERGSWMKLLSPVAEKG